VTTPATILVGRQALTPAMLRTLTELARVGQAVRANPYRASDWTWRIDGKPCSNSWSIGSCAPDGLSSSRATGTWS
jgi:hypothetical protein